MRTFDQLKTKTIRFLQGKIKSLPTYGGPPHEETALIQKELIKMNKMNLITTNSEPFKYYIRDGKRYRQRPYVQFYIFKENADAFISNLLKLNENVCINHCLLDERNFKIHHNFNAKKLAELTWDSPTKIGLHQVEINGTWVEDNGHVTSFWFEYFNEIDEYYYELREDLTQKCYFILLFADQFNNQIFQDIITAYKQIKT